MSDHRRQIDEVLGRQHGWTPIAVFIDGEHHSARRLLELAEQRRWRLIGLVKFGPSLPDDLDAKGAVVTLPPDSALTQQLLDQRIPTVRIGMFPHELDGRVPAVTGGRPLCGGVAAEHFAEREFKHVAFVGNQPWGEQESLFAGFRGRAEELGMQCHLLQIDVARLRAQLKPDAPSLGLRRELFSRWIGELPKPVGLLCSGDARADLYCQWALEAGLGVPDEVAVLGIGDDPFVCQSAPVTLSSVVVDHDRIAERAVEALERLMSGKALDETTMMVPPRRVVTRRSTDVLAATAPLVVRTLRYMWDHVTEDLSVDRIAKQMGVSRRTLERGFQQELGRGINQELQRRRLDKACELLVQTNLPVARIAEGLGFGSHTYFGQVFRAAHGASPLQYRRQRAASG